MLPDEWEIRWYATPGGQATGTFRPITGEGSVSKIDAEDDLLVAVFDRMVYQGKKIPMPALRMATKAVQDSKVAEDNGRVGCVTCGVDKEDEPLHMCYCCSKKFHACCLPTEAKQPAEEDGERAAWWCPACEEAAS